MKSSFLLLLLLINVRTVFCQTITGTIYSATTDRPLANATVVVKSTLRKKITGPDGSFTIEAKLADTLIISHVGYEVLEVNQPVSPLRIILKLSPAPLQEVTISTGFQEVPQERLTGSFVKVDNALFNRSVSTDILSRLDGVTPGLLFDKRKEGNAGLQLRGLSTLIANSAPLIVVDNFPYEGSLLDLNPADIENVTVLRDAAAASIWGARAGNGVIVITTKKGKYNQPLRVSLMVNQTVLGPPDLFKVRQVPIGAYIDLENFLFAKGFFDADISNTTNRPPLSPVVEILARQRSGTLSTVDAREQIEALKGGDFRRDLQRFIYQEGVNQQYTTSVSGGNGTAKYYASAGLDRNQLTLKGNGYHRVTLRLDNTFAPLRNLTVQLSLNFTATKSTFNSPGGYGAYTTISARDIYPYARLRDQKGEALPLALRYRRGYTDTAGGGRLLDWNYLPLEELTSSDNRTGGQSLLSNIGIKYAFSKALDIEVKYAGTVSDTRLRNYRSLQTFFSRDLVNLYTQLGPTTATYPIPRSGILDMTTTSFRSAAGRVQLNYSQQWGIHRLQVLAGGEVRQNGTSLAQYRTYGYDERLNTAPVDYVTRFTRYLSGNATIPYSQNFEEGTDRFVSFFANAGYAHKNRYLLSGSIRRDASNLFGAETNQRGKPFWSTGLGWKISEEAFYHSTLFPVLGLRLSYGLNGNIDPSVSALTIIRYSSPIAPTNLPSALVVQNPNPHLRWEQTATFNAGVDFSTKGDRIKGSLEYYTKTITDVLGGEPQDPSTGIGTIITNSANMKTKGVDVSFTTKNLNRPAFQWQTHWLFSYVDYKVTRYLLNNAVKGYVSGGDAIFPIKGYNPYLVVSFQWGGLDPLTGDPQGYVNKQLSKDYNAIVLNPLENQVIAGPALPPFFGAIRNGVSYKALSLSANISYRFGYFFRRPALNYSALFSFSRLEDNGDYQKRWQTPGDEKSTHVPSLQYPAHSNRDLFYTYSAVTVEKGDNIRLEDLRLEYAFTKEQVKTLPFRSIELYTYLGSLNLILWKANKAGLDPDYPAGLLPSRSYTLGCKFNF